MDKHSKPSILNTVSHMDIFDLCDCLQDELKHRFNLLLNPLRALVNVSFPKPQNIIAAFFKVGILGIVFSHLSHLPVIKRTKFIRVAVPIIPVKLNDEIGAVDISINTEFSSDNKLWGISNPDTVNYLIGDYFEVVWAKCLLIYVKCHKALCMVGIIITALLRAVYSFAVNSSGRRYKKLFSTRFTNYINLVSRLPFISTMMRAEPRIYLRQWDIKSSAAYLTFLINTILFREWLARLFTAFIGTIHLRSEKGYVTLRAIMIFTTVRNSTFCWHVSSYFFNVIILCKAIRNNSVVLFEYLAKPYTLPMFEEVVTEDAPVQAVMELG